MQIGESIVIVKTFDFRILMDLHALECSKHKPKLPEKTFIWATKVNMQKMQT